MKTAKENKQIAEAIVIRRAIFILIYLQLMCVSLQIERSANSMSKEVKVVFALTGLRLRERPDLYSKNQVTIPYGSELEILSKIEGKIKVDYYTAGEWVEVRWQGRQGYVFDGYLLNKKEFSRFNKAYRYLQARSLEKKENQRYKYFLEYEVNKKSSPSPLFYLEKKSNSNFTVYTFMPEKYSDREHCNFYMSSTCINIILDDADNIIFTDLDFESMGVMDFIDEDIVRFGYDGGDGDNCNGGGLVTSFVYIFKSKTYIKGEFASGQTCVDACDPWDTKSVCKKWKDYKRETYSPSNESLEKIKSYFERKSTN